METVTVDPIRKILPYTSIALLIAVVYVGYTFYSRHSESQAVEERAEQKELEQDRDAVNRMGGTSLKITSFYANPGVIHRGASAKICYGVVNASSVEMDPPVEKVWPSLSRCFDVVPRQTTTYKLVAQGQGKSVTKSVDITVQ